MLRRESELEEGLFTQRQALLDEMEALKMREMELKRQAELDKRWIIIEIIQCYLLYHNTGQLH